MTQQISLMLNGPIEWYENLLLQFERYGRTWLQQNGSLSPKYQPIFNEMISTSKYFQAFGYVKDPVKKVSYRLRIDEIVSDGKKRIPPPDETAPGYKPYDHTQGKCDQENDYKYVLWLKVIHIEKIDPISPAEFICSNTERPLDKLRALHFYVNTPEKFTQRAVAVTDEEERPDHFADQFSILQELEQLPERRAVSAHPFVRSLEVRRRVLARAQGKCEWCEQPGFMMESGQIFLETHHVIPLSEEGSDTESNVVALCPNHHREAHHGLNSQKIREVFLNRFAKRQW